MVIDEGGGGDVREMNKSYMRDNNVNRVFVAQWIAHQTSNLGVVGSSPTEDGILFSIN